MTTEALMLQIGGDDSGARGVLRGVAAEANAASSSIARAANTHGSMAARGFGIATAALGSLVMGAGAAAAAVGGLAATMGGFALKAAADFEHGMAAVHTMIDDTAAFRRLEEQVRKLPAALGDTSSITGALYDIVGAGVDAAEAVGVTEVALKAATAGMTDGRTAADALTSAMNAYQMNGLAGATKAGDVLFESVNRGKMTFEALARSVGQVMPTAATAGVRFEEVAAAFATITKTGGGAARASTEIAGVINKLMKPSEKSIKLFKKLGIEWGQDALQAKGLTGVLTEISLKTNLNTEAVERYLKNVEEGKDAWSGIGDKLRPDVEAVLTLFEDMEAGRGALKLMAGEMKSYLGDLDAMGKASQANGEVVSKAYAKIAATFTHTFGTAWETVKQTARDAGAEMLPLATAGLKDATAWLEAARPRIQALAKEVVPVVAAWAGKIKSVVADFAVSSWNKISWFVGRVRTLPAEFAALWEGYQVDPEAVLQHLGLGAESAAQVVAAVETVKSVIASLRDGEPFDALRTMGMSPGDVSSLQGATQSAKMYITDMLGVARTSAEQTGAAIRQVWGVVSTDVAKALSIDTLPAIEQFRVLGEAVAGTVADIAAEMPASLDYVVGGIGTVAETIARGFSTMNQWITVAIPEGLGELSALLENKMVQGWRDAGDSVSEVLRAIRAGVDSVVAAITAMVDTLLGLPAKAMDAVAKARAAVGEFKLPTFGDIGNKVIDLGKSAAGGVGSAIRGVSEYVQPTTPPVAPPAAPPETPAAGGGGWRAWLGLAGGGVVPGTGNTDSVPAMLQPGELVVPTSQVPMVASAMGAGAGAAGGGASGDPAPDTFAGMMLAMIRTDVFGLAEGALVGNNGPNRFVARGAPQGGLSSQGVMSGGGGGFGFGAAAGVGAPGGGGKGVMGLVAQSAAALKDASMAAADKGTGAGIEAGAKRGAGGKDDEDSMAGQVFKAGLDSATDGLVEGLMSGDVKGAIKGFAKDLGKSAMNSLKQAMKESLSSKILKFLGMSMGAPTPAMAGGGYAAGGLTLVGEEGPELVNMPRGAYVNPADETADMLAGAGGWVVNLYFGTVNVYAGGGMGAAGMSGGGSTWADAARQLQSELARALRVGEAGALRMAIADVAGGRK